MSNIRIETCILGQISTNCYLVYNTDTKEAVIIDPGDNASYVSNKCGELGVVPKAIFLTHGHFDHILAVPELKQTFHADVYASEEEDPLLSDSKLNLSGGLRGPQTVFHADVSLKDGQELELLGTEWRVILTPGHTAGSCCFYLPEEGLIFAGDTLFNGSYGVINFPTGNVVSMVKSILNRLFELPEDTMVYTGHGIPTTLGMEKKGNPIYAVRDNILRVKGPDALK